METNNQKRKKKQNAQTFPTSPLGRSDSPLGRKFQNLDNAGLGLVRSGGPDFRSGGSAATVFTKTPITFSSGLQITHGLLRWNPDLKGFPTIHSFNLFWLFLSPPPQLFQPWFCQPICIILPRWERIRPRILKLIRAPICTRTSIQSAHFVKTK